MRFLALIAIVLPIIANAQEITKPRLTVLENGLRIVTVEDHRHSLVSAVWSVRAGDSTEPPASAGISHFVEHLVSGRGTLEYPGNAISALVTGRGGHANAETWYDSTIFELVLPSNEVDRVLSLHEQMMFWAVFSEKGFETEKSAVFEELRGDQDQPYGYLWDKAPYKIYPIETFYSRSTNGTIEKLRSITVERARQYYRDHYVPNNMSLVLVGDFDTEKLLAKISSRLGKYKRRSSPPHQFAEIPIRPRVTVVTEELEIAKSYFLFALEGPKMSSPDYLPFEVLMHYIGGKSRTALLHEMLVKRRAVLQKVLATPLRRRFGKGWQPITGEGQPEKIATGIDGLLSILSQLRARGVSQESLSLTKNRLVSAYRLAMDDRLKYARLLAETDASGDYRFISEYEARLGRVSPEDVWAVAKKYFQPNKFFLMALFPTGRTPKLFADEVRLAADRHSRKPSIGVVSRVLQNGATLLYEFRPGSLVESITVAVRAGERDDGKRPGLAKATATMLRRLTSRRSPDQLQEFLDREGISLSEASGKDGTTFSVSASFGKTEMMAKFVKEMLTQPDFPADEWQAVRRSLASAATSKLDEPREIAENELMARLFTSAYGARLSEYKSSIDGISRSDLIAFHRAFYSTERIAVAYVGQASLNAVAVGLSGKLGAIQVAPRPVEAVLRPIFRDGIESFVVPMRGKQQVNLLWAWPGPQLRSDDWILWLLAQRAFGGDESGRLWRLRQKAGLAYEIWCDSLELKDGPLVVVYMAFAKDKYEQAVTELDREIVRLLRDGIGHRELERVKAAFIMSLELTNQTAVQRSDRLADWWLKGLSPNQMERSSRVATSATVSSVNRVLRQTLSMERVMKVEVGAVAPN